jgi:hypothetical protein
MLAHFGVYVKWATEKTAAGRPSTQGTMFIKFINIIKIIKFIKFAGVVVQAVRCAEGAKRARLGQSSRITEALSRMKTLREFSVSVSGFQCCSDSNANPLYRRLHAPLGTTNHENGLIEVRNLVSARIFRSERWRETNIV